MNHLIEAVKKFPELSVAVVGDLMLDRYIMGDIERISPESTAPVVVFREEKVIPGGAANTAYNIALLGARVHLVGRIGRDATGDIMRDLLKHPGIKTLGLVSGAFVTTEKSRIVVKSNQIVRLDKEDISYCDTKTEDTICKRLHTMGTCHAIVVSDYAKGTITPRIAEAILDVGRKKGIPVVVDTKPRHAELFRGATIFTPNKKEAEEMSGVAILDQKSLEKAGHLLQSKLQSHILITRGAEGMSLFTENSIKHFPSVAREVYDVTGAGDTVAALFALGLASKLSFEDAASLATVAAGIVVGKQGTATIAPEELLHAVTQLQSA